ncbi:MAG: AtpZ/AtpI family protein [Anaerolineaceae bacterium]|nr:AtpZ/AtpI family protein [Anaerolineaceae bacterium]
MKDTKLSDTPPENQPDNPVEGKPIRRHRLFSARDLRATTIGWEIAIPIVGGPLLGFFLDRQFGTGSRWTFILLGVGVLSAIAAVVRYVRYEFYVMNKEVNEKKAEELQKMKDLIKEQEHRRRKRYGK